MRYKFSEIMITDEQWAVMSEEDRIEAAREGHINGKQREQIEKEGSQELRAALDEYLSKNSASILSSITLPSSARSTLEELCSLRHLRSHHGMFDEGFLRAILPIHEQFKTSPLLSDEIAKMLNLGASLSGVTNSPVAAAAREASLSIFELFKTAQPGGNFVEELGKISSGWIDHLGSSKLDIEIILGSHLAGISELSMLGQSSIAGIRWEDFAGALSLPSADKSLLRDHFFDFTDSYKDLFKSFEESPPAFLSLAPDLSESPAREFFIGARLAGAISGDAEEGDVEEESRRVGEEIGAEVEEELRQRLLKLDPRLVKLVDGARASFRSSYPDRSRHLITSYRELCTHILHLLSPDPEIKNWSTTKDHYHNGRPTRKARLLYLCRDINHGPLREFVEKDIETTVITFDLLNQGTHQLDMGLTDKQLAALKARAEATVSLLIQIYVSNIND